MAGEEVVIVDDDGTEHVFPAGFDPVKAAGIVKTQKPLPPPSLVEMMGQRQPGGYTQSDTDPPPSDAIAGLKHLAHPESLSDLLGLVLPSGMGAPVRVTGEMLGSWFSALKRSIPQSKSLHTLPIEMLKTLYADAYPAEKALNGARLSKTAAAKLEETLVQALQDVRKADTVNAPITKAGGAAKALRTVRNIPVTNPEIRGGMVTTQPDKWGVTTIRPSISNFGAK